MPVKGATAERDMRLLEPSGPGAGVNGQGRGIIVDNPLTKLLANGHKVNLPVAAAMRSVSLDGGTEAGISHSILPRTLVYSLKELGGIENDGLRGSAIHIDRLLKHGRASDVLKLFGDPKSVNKSDKVYQVKLGDEERDGDNRDRSTITAYDGLNNLVLNHVIDKRTIHSYILNGAILRDIDPIPEENQERPIGREIILPYQTTRIIDSDGKSSFSHTATVIRIQDGHVSALTRSVKDFRRDDPVGSRMADCLEIGIGNIQPGTNDTERLGGLSPYRFRDVLDGGNWTKDADLAAITVTVDAAAEADKEVLIARLEPLLHGTGETLKDAATIEGIRLGERVPVAKALQNMQPYSELFGKAMGASIQVLPDDPARPDMRTRLVSFPAGSYATTTRANLDSDTLRFIPKGVDPVDIVGHKNVGIKVEQNRQTGERSASLLIGLRVEEDPQTQQKSWVVGEEVSLENATMVVTRGEGKDTRPTVEFTFPGESSNQNRVIRIRTETMDMGNESAKFTNKPFSVVTDSVVTTTYS